MAFVQQTIEALSITATGALQAPLQSLLRDTFQTHVIPAFEHATQTMANQINTAFQSGTKECKYRLMFCIVNLYGVNSFNNLFPMISIFNMKKYLSIATLICGKFN